MEARSVSTYARRTIRTPKTTAWEAIRTLAEFHLSNEIEPDHSERLLFISQQDNKTLGRKYPSSYWETPLQGRDQQLGYITDRLW